MYIMLDVRAVEPDCEAFAWALLDAEKVAVMPGSSFGDAAAGHIRISLCQPEPVLADAAMRLKRFVRLSIGGKRRDVPKVTPTPYPSPQGGGGRQRRRIPLPLVGRGKGWG
jgi:hypothetical protein